MTVPPDRYVVLLRVSTEKQGADGLGVAAQRRDIDLFLQQHPRARVLKELVEVESGGKELHDRPVLQEAMDLCRSSNSTLLVAKLSRLSRDAAFVLTLMKDSTIQFKVAAMPDADNFQLGIYALLNQQEREQSAPGRKQHLLLPKQEECGWAIPRTLRTGTAQGNGQHVTSQISTAISSGH